VNEIASVDCRFIVHRTSEPHTVGFGIPHLRIREPRTAREAGTDSPNTSAIPAARSSLLTVASRSSATGGKEPETSCCLFCMLDVYLTCEIPSDARCRSLESVVRYRARPLSRGQVRCQDVTWRKPPLKPGGPRDVATQPILQANERCRAHGTSEHTRGGSRCVSSLLL